MTRQGKGPVNLARLAEILDAYGADPRRWPAEERAAVEKLIAESVDAGSLHADAAALDKLMDLAIAPAASPELMARVLAGRGLAGADGWLAILWPFGPVWQPLSAMALLTVLGIAIGATAPDIVIPDYGDSAIAEVESLTLGPALNLDNGL